MSTTKLPTLPWYCSHATPVPDAEDLASVHDANGQLVAIVQPGGAVTGELIAMAPELLRELHALVSATLQLDPDYCRQHRIQFDPEGLRNALCDALATLNHARDHGLPCEVPQR